MRGDRWQSAVKKKETQEHLSDIRRALETDERSIMPVQNGKWKIKRKGGEKIERGVALSDARGSATRGKTKKGRRKERHGGKKGGKPV